METVIFLIYRKNTLNNFELMPKQTNSVILYSAALIEISAKHNAIFYTNLFSYLQEIPNVMTLHTVTHYA
jgi:hypothetical protein